MHIDQHTPCDEVEAELLFITAHIIAQRKRFVNSFFEKIQIFFAAPSYCQSSDFPIYHYDIHRPIQNTQKDLRQTGGKFSTVYFSPKNSTKNRTKWIFTKPCR